MPQGRGVRRLVQVRDHHEQERQLLVLVLLLHELEVEVEQGLQLQEQVWVRLRQRLVLVHDHHGQALERQQQVVRHEYRVNRQQVYLLRLEYHRDKLFSASIVCSPQSL